MSSVSTNTVAFISGAVSARPFGLLKSMINMVQLYKERRELAALDANALADIGVTRQEALAEASRPTWDVPEYWHN